MKQLLCVSILLLLATAPIRAADYVVEEMREEGTPNLPFSIARVQLFPGGLRLFLSTNDIVAVASLVSSGALQGQLSDNVAEIETIVPLSLGKAVWCAQDGTPVYLGYEDSLSACSDTGQPPERVEYLPGCPSLSRPGRDLALGKDPDYLWLIEER